LLFFLLNKDVIGIVDTCSGIIPFTNRTSNIDSKRREVTLIDEDTSISITLWDEQVKEFIQKKISFELFRILGRKFR
jgi:hypothetical protein